MKKTIYKNFDYTQCNEFAAFLSEMAAQGWHFKEWSLGLVFEKGEPSQVEYAVEIFSHGKEEDLRPEPQTEEFAEYCEAAGWKFVDAKRKFCIFKKLRDDAIEIVTPEERIENIKNAEVDWIKNEMIISACIFLHRLMPTGSDIKTRPFDGMGQILMLGVLLLLMFLLYKIVRVKKWVKEQEQYLSMGGEIVPLKTEKVTRTVISIVVSIIFIAYCVLKNSYIGLLVFVAITVLLVILELVIKKYRPSRQRQSLIAGGLFLSMIAICAIVFTIISEKDFSKLTYQNSMDKSIFGTREVGYFEYNDSQMIKYTKYRSDIEWLMDKVWKEETEHISDTSNSIYGIDAEEIETLADWRYMIRNPKCIVVIENTEDVPVEDIQTIIEEIGVR